MKDFKKELNQILSTYKDLADKRIDLDKINEIVAHTASKLSDMKPVISLYGAYNAGKSTLLNALTGEDIAKEGSSPETFKVEKYSWGEWTIFDTPGIDAPIEHENTTEEHIKKSECILFVISTDGDLESAPIYDKIADLTLRKKPLLMVLNDKNKILNNEDMGLLNEIISKIDINLEKTWEKHNIKNADKPEKFVVNARSAKKAKFENKSLLLQKSCIKDLEYNIEQFLRTKDETDIVNSLADYINDPIEELQNIIISELDNPALQKIEKVRKDLELEKKKLNLKIKKMLRNHLDELSASLYSFDLLSEQNQITDHINNSINMLSEKIQTILEKELGSIADKYEQESRIGIIGEIENSVSDEVSGLKDSEESIVGNLVDNSIKLIPKEQAEQFTKQGLEKAFLKFREFKIPFFKGRWSTTFNKWATKWAGPIVLVAFAGWEIFSSYKKQKKYEQQIASQHQTYELMIKKTKNELYENFQKETYSIVDEFFSEIFDDLKNMENNLKKEAGKSEEDLERIKNLQNRIHELID
jgi:predicted GTPase